MAKIGIIAGAIFLSFFAFFGFAQAQVIPGQNQITQSPFGGLVYSTSTSGTAKLGQLKGTAFGDITYWNGTQWITAATSTLGIATGAATSSFSATYPVKVTVSTSAINYSLLNMGTTTASCAGTVSCPSFIIIGSSPVTITGTGSAASEFNFLTNFGTTTFATTTPFWAQGGVFASSTASIPTLAVQQSGTGPAAIFNGGNIGIGTSSPISLLDIVTPNSGVVTMINLRSTAAAASEELALDMGADSLTSGTVRSFARISSTAGSGFATPLLKFWTDNGSGLLTAWMFLDKNGFLGVASTTPTNRLSVDSGSIDLNGNAGTYKQDNVTILTASSTTGVTLGGLLANSSELSTTTSDLGNTAFGYQAMQNATTSMHSTAFGYLALKGGALRSAQFDGDNTAFGWKAVTANTSGHRVIGIGYQAGAGNTTANDSVYIGYNSGKGGNSSDTTCLGFNTCASNSFTGLANTAVGANALANVQGGAFNVAFGGGLFNLTSGSNNIALGVNAGNGITGSSGNLWIGNVAGGNVGDNNVIIGHDAGGGFSGGTPIKNIILGPYSASTTAITGSHNLMIGYDLAPLDPTLSNTMVIGNLLYGNNMTSESSSTPAGNFGVSTTTPGSVFSIGSVANFTAATSTFYGTGGHNLVGGGCYAINGTCIGGSGGGVSSVSGTFPIVSSGGATPVISWGGTATATPFAAGQIVLTNGSSNFYTVASSSLNLPNTALANSTISGTALGGTLPSHSVGASLTGTAYNGSAAVSNWGINLANPNQWTALQNFDHATTSAITATSSDVFLTGLTAGTGNGALCLTTAGQVQFSSAANCVAGGAGTPAGASTNIQTNNAGSFGATSGFSYDGTFLTIPGYINMSAPAFSNGAWIKFASSTFAYASSTNHATVFGILAGGNNATTSTANNQITAIGYGALQALTTGIRNTAVGEFALKAVTTSPGNTAVGAGAIPGVTTNATGQNTGIGFQALNALTNGAANVAIGYDAGQSVTGNQNINIGTFNNGGSGSSNIQIGYSQSQAVTGSNNILIGSQNALDAIGGNAQLNIGNVIFGQSMYTSAANTAFPSANGSIGISTSTPWGKLAISLNSNDTATLQAFTVASSTASATTTLFRIDNIGHIYASSTNPVVSSCGTSPTLTGSDQWGEVVPGATATTCTVTFGHSYTQAPICTVTNQSMSITSALSYTISSTALTISQAVGLAGDKLDYHCFGVALQ